MNVKIVYLLNECNKSIQTYSVNFSYFFLIFIILNQNQRVCSKLISFLKCGVLLPIIILIDITGFNIIDLFQMINQSKLRVDLRFYAELINTGIFTHKEGLPLLGNVLTVLVNMDREEHNNVNIILSFCRHCGEDYAGIFHII